MFRWTSRKGGAVAYSGGIDSSYLLKSGLGCLGASDNVIAAVTCGNSEMFSNEEFESSARLGRSGLRAPVAWTGSMKRIE
ncbi:MAG: hypothetical protein ACLVJN_08550 [Streptococcus parasanguinis]